MKTHKPINPGVLLLTAISVLLFVVTANAQDIQGTQNGGGLLVRNYGDPLPTVSGVPLLNTFYFSFRNGNSRTDHHIAAIRVLPGGSSIDLSPSAQAPHHVVPNNRIELMYQDKNPDDTFAYRISHRSPLLTTGQRFQIRDVGCKGVCERRLPTPPGGAENSVFALVGFYVFFTGGRDHHVDEIAVFEENGVLTVKLNDKKNDDVFGYMIDYTWLRPGTQRILEREIRDVYRDGGGAAIPLPATSRTRAISGFSFNYLSKDHHLGEIGVVFDPERLQVFYGDKNGDDDVRWRLKWVEIGPQVLAPLIRTN
jgi:hypothetical protein